MKLSLAIVIGLVASVPDATTTSYEVHEKREFTNPVWVSLDIELNRREIVPVSIGLTQQNLDNGHEYLMDVSDPISPNYSSHWTPERVAEGFAPSQETIEPVKAWLVEHGIAEDRLSLSKGSGWIKFNSTVGEVEDLLKTKYELYEHSESRRAHLACHDYSVPASIRAHIDFITPTIHFDAVVTEPKKKRQFPESVVAPIRSSSIDIPSQIKQGPALKISSFGATPQASQFTLANCNSYITPDCLRALYGFLPGTLANHLLELWNIHLRPCFEYAIALVYPQKVTLYQVGDIVEGGSFNTFPDALDLTYCTSGGGDTPGIDPSYPDAYSGGTKACGTITPASVISTSYGYNEADLSPAYATRQCNEYMKLGLQGITILYSSGDNGATLQRGAAGMFNPSFPSTCPYITSVGATHIAAGNPVTAPEQACMNVIYSGGGFSNLLCIAELQSTVVAHYLRDYKPSYSSTQYNNSKKQRGYPDISANGANYLTYVDGVAQLVFGTSASSPTVGAIITLINEQRANVGKKPVGFINPVLYENPGALNDITVGTNPGVGRAGSVLRRVGYDPVTGLGTPNYPKLLSVFMALK
ncbi:hypothetical protein NA56DRAFT_712256 [Hyaloscypha hepaticicola]|uniref:tripeptidyl-peptidase II n=1 Tax=Hyaloscypha hepaticicola TaxID=2082293 RepID=A0A2J6PGP5_9HELO|nr:hypothetical protein NA56DRAFT_712256 [Hyaloscypha hepaticicola]